MTSGVFHNFEVPRIFVNREERQRREITDTEIIELSESIARVGLIHPPVIRRDGELIVGERRWRAVSLLKWPTIPVQFIEDLSEEELKQVELEENLRRKDIPWIDECNSIKTYHELRKGKEENWTVEKTAEALGYDQSSVSRKISVAEAVLTDERVAQAPKFSTAMNIVSRTNERKRAAALESISIVQKPPTPIINTSFITWSRDYDGPKFNMLFCDFPYGMNADKHDQGKAPEFGGYDDRPEVYWELINAISAAMDSVVDQSAHLIFWFNMDFYEDTKTALQAMGWRLDKRLLIWYKSDGSSILPDPNRGPRWCYETAFFGSRGDRPIAKAVNNLVPAGITKEFHMSEKPIEVCRHFLRMTTDEFTTFLDPTCGSGNSVISARELGARLYTGLEINSEFCGRAEENFRQHSE